MQQRIVYQIDSFTKTRFRGNPASVVVNADGLLDDQMQCMAREFNNSETAFLFPPDDGDCDGVIRYFTPKMEVPTCGHATIAAMVARALEDKLDSCVLNMKTQIGVLPFEIIKGNGDYQAVMTQGKFELGPRLNDESTKRLRVALGLGHADLDSRCPIQIASTGHSKVMIGINSRATLNQLTPNFGALVELSAQIDCKGYFVFTFDSDDPEILTYGRMFAPAVGIDEDPVTGNANGPLGGYLVTNRIVDCEGNVFQFNGGQGEKIDRFGVVTVRVEIDPMLVQIRGDAVVVFRTEIML